MFPGQLATMLRRPLISHADTVVGYIEKGLKGGTGEFVYVTVFA